MRTSGFEETQAAAAEFVKGLAAEPDRAVVVGLRGDLGAGKTTFVQGVARSLGINESVQSPTYVIQKIYEISHPDFKRLVHIDAYRLESGSELERLNWKETISDPGNLVLVEWPERVEEVMPMNSVNIEFKHVSEDVREIAWKDPSTKNQSSNNF